MSVGCSVCGGEEETIFSTEINRARRSNGRTDARGCNTRCRLAWIIRTGTTQARAYLTAVVISRTRGYGERLRFLFSALFTLLLYRPSLLDSNGWHTEMSLLFASPYPTSRRASIYLSNRTWSVAKCVKCSSDAPYLRDRENPETLLARGFYVILAQSTLNNSTCPGNKVVCEKNSS